MNKIKAITIALVMIAMTSAPLLTAEEEGITINMDPATMANITINNQTWNVSASLGGSDTFDYNLTNVGDVQVDVNISIPQYTTNTDGGSYVWETVTDEAPMGYSWHDEIRIHSSEVGGNIYDNIDYSRTQEFASNLPPSGQSGNVVEDTLTLHMPDTSSTNDNQTMDVTFTATAD